MAEDCPRELRAHSDSIDPTLGMRELLLKLNWWWNRPSLWEIACSIHSVMKIMADSGGHLYNAKLAIMAHGDGIIVLAKRCHAASWIIAGDGTVVNRRIFYS